MALAFKLAEESAREAGALLRRGFYEDKKIDTKSSSVDWVTQYDRDAESLIVNRVLEAFPDHSIVGEEGSRIEGGSDFRWYIDPLDGTNNFAHQFPIFSVSIAIYEGETPLCGIVYDPLRDEAFTAIMGEGAFLDSPHGHKDLTVSATDELGRSLLATGFPYDRQTSPHNNTAEVTMMISKAQGVRRPGSAALDMAYVAAGRLDGYWEFKLYAWDMAAARLIVEEAGGKVTTPEGEAVKMEEKLSLLVTNGRIHDQVLATLSLAADKRQESSV